MLFIGAQNYAKTEPGWFIKKLRHMIGSHSLEDILPNVTAHTLVIRGNRDRVCPRAWVAEVAALIPDATMVEVPGRGHETMVKDGVCVAERIMEHLGVSA
ncbi:alpha/beta fold hydrolase [Arthrobacter psychrolactophilus]